jgi:DNA helicase-2/ATP-dependent DNA helicase PcrA
MQSAIQSHIELPHMRNKDPLDAFLDGLRKAKMELLPLSTITIEYGNGMYPFEPVFYSYLEKQLGANFLDFDDMIYMAIRALLKNNSRRHGYQSKFEFVLVDEFQDLNQAQLLLLQILSLPENNIFAVGDDDQMIYGFRGADVRHFVEFDKRFPISSNHVLGTNYRSSRMIVRHSGWLINNNVDRVKKNIQPRRDAQTGKFEISGHPSLFEQAEYAAAWLVKHREENRLNWRDYAFLYRYNAYQFPIAVILDKLDVPHAPLSGQHLFQTTVGKDVQSYLHVALFPQDAAPEEITRILSRPNKFFTNRLISQAQNWSSFLRLPEIPDLKDWERDKLTDFISRMETLSSRARTQNIPSVECMQILKTELGLADFYRDQSRKSDDLDQASDEIYFDVICALAENSKTAMDFYQFICRSMDDGGLEFNDAANTETAGNAHPKANEVYLSTIHKAKGKEFNNVVYFNLSKSEQTQAQIEETRRVVYVGATRAKDDLLVTFSSTKPSIFLLELSQNPKYKSLGIEEIKSRVPEFKRNLEKEKYFMKQLGAKKEKAAAKFDALTKTEPGKRPIGLSQFSWNLQNWRINKAMGEIQKMEEKTRKLLETRIIPLMNELSELDEEINIRNALAKG